MPITIPTKNDPTPPSRKAWVAAAWTGIIANIFANIATNFGLPPIAAAGFGIVGLGGGYLYGRNEGEKQQHRELREGRKDVKEPRFWNYKLAQGFATAGLINGCVNMLYYAGAMPFSQRGLAIVGTAQILGALGLTVAGGISGKHEMQREYAAARQIEEAERKKTIAAAVEKAHTHQHETSIEVQTEQGAAKFTAAEEAKRAAKVTEQDTQQGMKL